MFYALVLGLFVCMVVSLPWHLYRPLDARMTYGSWPQPQLSDYTLSAACFLLIIMLCVAYHYNMLP
jgi:hypothetical protein